ncbi:MAG: recombinase family protein [Lachnospiraceae bacterium]|nr:recombinase family protein [Lachnospiraceae bacterium]
MRTVFRLYLEGYSAAKISEHLQEKGIRTMTMRPSTASRETRAILEAHSGRMSSE